MNIYERIQSESRQFVINTGKLPQGILLGYGAAAKLDEHMKEIGALPIHATIKDLSISNVRIFKTPDHLNDEIIVF